MPMLEYECQRCGHRTERFFRSISDGEEIVTVHCEDCNDLAQKVPSIPLQAHLYGNPDGYHKPSPTKRFNTKTVSQIQGNSSAIG